MKNIKQNWSKSLAFRFGLPMLAGFIAYFFIMKAVGLYTNVELRILNVLIHGAFVYAAMKAYRNETQESFSYLKTFSAGLSTSVLPVLGFAMFQYLYLSFINPSFFGYVQENAILGDFLTPFNASVFLVIEGFGVSMLASYVGMRALCVQEEVPAVS